jgi:hypothetical protein
MEKEFVPYELALRIKAIGFDEPCWGYYYTLNGRDWKFAEKTEYHRLDDEMNIGGKFTISAPLFQQAFRWFRENGFICHITNDLSNNLKDEIYVYVMTKGYGTLIDRSEEYFTYEEAELACLQKLIEIVEEKQK